MAAIMALVLTGSFLVVVPPAAAAPAPAAATGVDPRMVPLLADRQLSGKRAAVAAPKADFTPLAGRREHFDKQRSRAVSRSTFVTEYANPDGTRTLQQSTEPLNVRDSSGSWRPVDTTVSVDAGTGRVRVASHPLSPTFGMRADDSGVLRVEAGGAAAWLGAQQASGSPVEVSGETVSYRGVWPDADLRYGVTAGTVKETIQLNRAPATGRASWGFRLGTSGLTPKLGKDGSVLFTDGAGKLVMAIPPVQTWDSSGTAERPPAATGGRYRLEPITGGWLLTVSVDEAWLLDPARVYPVSVDPSFSFAPVDSYAYKSDGYWCQNCELRIGNSLDQGDAYWRSVFHPDYQSLFGRTVVNARLDVANQRSATTVDRTYPAALYHASAFDFNGVGAQLATGLVGQVGSFSGDSFTSFLRQMVDTRDPYAYFMLVGNEAAGIWTYKRLAATLYVDTGTAAPAAALAGPADNSVLTTLTPTLSVSPVSDPDGDPVSYCFRVATGADAKSGVVVESGCLSSPSWTIPAGILQDGVAYTWRAAVYSGITSVEPSWVGHLRIDQRIGARGPAPVDTVGPISVNLANGNVTTSVTSPTFTTVGGTAGVTLTYNSQQGDLKGLRASYFNDLSHNGNIADGQQPVLVRTEPQVNVDWGTASPFPPALDADWFVVRWEGYFQAPVAGTYQLAGIHDDSLRIWLNNQQVYNSGCCSDVNWTQSTGVALTAGQRVPIKIELAEATLTAYLKLFVRTDDGTTEPPQLMPADWLYTLDTPALPTGWTLSADLDSSGASYTEATVADQTIVLTDTTGAKHTWTKKSDGGYTPPDGEDGILALDTSGRVTLMDGSDVYTFRSDGKLDTQSSALDSRKPAALQNIYDGTPSRLREIKDPVSGRSHRLYYNRPGDDCYGGATAPPGAQTPPPQMLCRIAYWDGSQTLLWYSGGQLTRVEDPGSEVSDFIFWTNGPLAGVRDNLAADWVAADPANRNNYDSIYLLGYADPAAAKPIATSLASPVPSPGKPRARHAYRPEPQNKQTFLDVAGLSPPIGFFTKVSYDDAYRLLSTTDATGARTSQNWNVKDQQLTATDPAGRVSTTVYDYADRPTDTYGPAPASCFTGQLPTAACADTVAHQHTNYDEGMNGLSVAYYDNTTMTGTPKVYATGFGDTTGQMAATWGDTTAPAPGIPAGTFAIRLSGEIQFPATGDYRMELYVDNGTRMWIDDRLVIDSWLLDPPRSVFGTYTNTQANSVHRIRVDYYNGGGSGALQVKWQPPGGTSVLVPGSYLRPRYGLTTSTVTAESGGVPDQASTTRYAENGLDPAYGLATSTTSGTGALQLTTATGYETPGTGYLRQRSKTLPSGGQTSYEYYGDTETRGNPCAPDKPTPVNQGGLAKLSRLPTAADGTARVDEMVYDGSGRVVAKSTAGGWICTSYDARDRVLTRTYPATASAAARTVTYNYAVGGDPLTTSVSDPAGTVTTQVDLQGRPVAYTDAQGTRTVTVYDQPGRVVTETVTPPNPADPAQVTSYTYDNAGRVSTTKLDGTVLATASYNAAGELAGVSYANGSALNRIDKDPASRVTGLVWATASGATVAATVVRTRSGTIVDEILGGTDPRPNAPNYLYDAAGRLTEAWVTGHHYTYDFTSTAPAACPTGTQANAGANTNRVRLLDQTTTGTAETGYCYDAADRILATTGSNPAGPVTHDGDGNLIQWTAGSSTTTLKWDGAGRNTATRTSGADPADITYTRDATDRIVRRDASSGDTAASVLYAYTSIEDTADLALNTDKRVLSRTIALPGGVVYTKPGTTGGQPEQWHHPSVRGDLVLTTNASGQQVGALRSYAPYGDPLTSTGTVDTDNVPDNQPGQSDYGWLGQHQRPYEHAGSLALVQMGARPYLPQFGRFLSVDPIDGGSANDYDYVNTDPINTTDLNGNKPKKCTPYRNRQGQKMCGNFSTQVDCRKMRNLPGSGKGHNFTCKPGTRPVSRFRWDLFGKVAFSVWVLCVNYWGCTIPFI